MNGYIRIALNYAERVKKAFIGENFNPFILQFRELGQLWGASKRLDYHNELHVRIINIVDAFGSGLMIEPEIEVPREFMEHLSPHFPSQPFHDPIIEALNRYDIPYQVVGTLPPDPSEVMRPTKYTKWKPLLVTGLALAGLFWLGTGKSKHALTMYTS